MCFVVFLFGITTLGLGLSCHPFFQLCFLVIGEEEEKCLTGVSSSSSSSSAVSELSELCVGVFFFLGKQDFVI